LSQDDAVSGRVPTGLNAPGLERAERRGIFYIWYTPHNFIQ
jgi:hypothetical protein